LVTVEDTRYALCHIKTVNLLPNVLASTYAEEVGADEAIFVKDGVVRECSHSNIAILSGGVLLTHPLDCHILPGIMRGALLEMAKRMGIVVEERAFSSDALFRAEGVFVTSTTRRVALANSIDGIELAPPSSLAKQLHFLFNRDFFEYMGKNT
jgi:D-alanine transaminase